MLGASHDNLYSTGLSLRAGGRGFSPATRSLNPGYFDTERKYWKEKNASNYKVMNYKTNQYFMNTNSYSSFKVRRPYNPCETDSKHVMFNNVYLSEARHFTKCLFHLVLLFSEFYVPRKCHPRKRKAEVDKRRKLDFFFSSSSASGKINIIEHYMF